MIKRYDIPIVSTGTLPGTCRDAIKPYVEQCSKLAADKIKLQEELQRFSALQSSTATELHRERDRGNEWKRLADERLEKMRVMWDAMSGCWSHDGHSLRHNFIKAHQSAKDWPELEGEPPWMW